MDIQLFKFKIVLRATSEQAVFMDQYVPSCGEDTELPIVITKHRHVQVAKYFSWWPIAERPCEFKEKRTLRAYLGLLFH
jgi:hypothetical protein